MAVLIRNSQTLLKVDKKRLRKITEDLLAFLGLRDRDLSILLVDNKKIAAFNNQFFGRNGPTNVISFSYGNGFPGELMGDLIISVERAREEAGRASISFYERVLSLVIHGILHVLGFDHEQGGNEARRMRYREKRLLTYVLSHDLSKEIGL